MYTYIYIYMRRKNIKDILPSYNMSMHIAKESSSSVLHSSSSFTKRFIAEGCAVGFCCGCYRYGHELLDGRADLGTVISGSLDSPVPGFRMLDLKNFPFTDDLLTRKSPLFVQVFVWPMRFVDPLCKRRWGRKEYQVIFVHNFSFMVRISDSLTRDNRQRCNSK